MRNKSRGRSQRSNNLQKKNRSWGPPKRESRSEGSVREKPNKHSKLIEALHRNQKEPQDLIPIDRSFQAKALELIRAGKNVLLSAPVGSGKTYLVYEIAKDQTVALAVPTKALANNVYAAAKAKQIPCKLTTGDFELEDSGYKLIIGTTEKISQLDELELPKVVFIDEASWIYDEDRGIPTYMDFLRRRHDHQFILMSGTIDHETTKTLFERLTAKSIELVLVEGSAIHHFYNQYVPRDLGEWKAIPKPCIVFCDNKMEATKLTHDLSEKNFQCALHHSSLDLLTKIKNEILLGQSKLDFLIGTSGLAYGINTPTRSVVVYHQGLASKETVAQVLGRAGRPGFWSRGFAFGIQEKSLRRPNQRRFLRLGLKDRCLNFSAFDAKREEWLEYLDDIADIEDICLSGRINPYFLQFMENDVPVEIQERLFRDIAIGKEIQAKNYLGGESYANDSTTLHWLEKLSENQSFPSISGIDQAKIAFEARWKIKQAMEFLRDHHANKEKEEV